MSTPLEKSPASSEQQHEPTSSNTLLYTHTFFSPEAAAARKALIPSYIVPLIYNAILLWACVALFFGSLLKNNDLSRITVTGVNLDDGPFGAGLINGIKGSLSAPGSHLRWDFPSITGDGDASSRDTILQERSWAVLQISANASSNLQAALKRGEASYDPHSAATLYFASARNQVTTLSVTLPPLMSLVNGIISQLAINSTATFLQANQDTSLATALQCPQCLASPFAVKQIDLIPFSSAAAFGTLNTGLIFVRPSPSHLIPKQLTTSQLLTFTFNTFTILHASASLHGHLFTLPTTLTIRFISSLAAYIFLSLMYTLALLPFSIPLTGHFHSPATGFTVLWLLNCATMSACGLAMESVFTLIGMQWAPYFLNVWIIANVSGAFAGVEIMPRFYEYGYAMPFYHCMQATRTVVFGTKNHLGVNFGVLGAWMGVGWVGGWGFTWWRMGRGRREGVHRVP